MITQVKAFVLRTSIADVMLSANARNQLIHYISPRSCISILSELIRQLIRSIDLRLNSLIRRRITFPALIVPIQPLPNHPSIISPLTANPQTDFRHPHRTVKSAKLLQSLETSEPLMYSQNSINQTKPNSMVNDA
jgi:hypothetical protein